MALLHAFVCALPRLLGLPSVRSPSSLSGYVYGTQASVLSPTTGVSARAKARGHVTGLINGLLGLHLRIAARFGGGAHPTPQPRPPPPPPRPAPPRALARPVLPGTAFELCSESSMVTGRVLWSEAGGSMPLQLPSASGTLLATVCMVVVAVRRVWRGRPSLPLCLHTPCAACVLPW